MKITYLNGSISVDKFSILLIIVLGLITGFGGASIITAVIKVVFG